MPIRRLDQTQWCAYFTAMSAAMIREGRIDYAEIRVLSQENGNQVSVSWLPLRGITYDPRSDILEVDVQGLGHFIFDPQVIYLDEDERGLIRMDVVRADGTEEIIELR